MILGKLAVSALVVDGGFVLVAVVRDGLAEADGEVGPVGAGPAVGDAVTRYERGTYYADLRPKSLAVVVVDAVVEVQHYVPVRSGEAVAVHSDPRGSGEFRPDAAVLQGDLIMAGTCGFGGMAETLAVSAVGILRRAGHQLHFAGAGHYQYISQVGMAGAAEVSVAEPDYGAVVVLIACAVLVGARLVLPLDVVGDHVGVGGELHSAEGHAGPREGMAHAGSAYEGIDVSGFLRGEGRCQAQKACK